MFPFHVSTNTQPAINWNRFFVLFGPISILNFHTNCIALISQNVICVEILRSL